MRPSHLRWHLVTTAGALAWLAPLAAAHSGFGGAVETRFAFPSWVVWAAGGLVVAVSFAVVGAFLTRASPEVGEGRSPLRVVAVAREANLGWTWGRLLGLVVLVLVVANAFNPASDGVLPQTVVWLGVWALLPLVAYTVGNVWPFVSPFHGLAGFAATARGGRDPVPWPKWLDAWPAVVFFVALVGLEVSGVGWADRAGPLGILVFAYALLTLVGMVVFGASAWLSQAEVVTVTMRWWGAASPLAWQDGRPRWRGFAASLAALPVRTPAQVVFTVAVLYGVNFDGFLVTPAGRAALAALDVLGGAMAHVLLLVAGLGLFVAVWFVAARAIGRAAESLRGVRDLSAVFAASLLPIAVAYHLAHNVFTLVEQSPRFLYAVLDPLGFTGWPGAWLHVPERVSLPGSWAAGLGALQVALVLLGHMVAVLVAHRLAERAFPGRIMALRGELPLTFVMVAYTWVGLWVLVSAGGGA